MLDNGMVLNHTLVRQIRKVIVDASHGGDDTGVVVDGLSEKDLVLSISKYMYDKIKSLGIPVSLTRDMDITLTDDDRANKILNTYGNSSDIIVISNHVDSDEDNAQIIYALRNNSSLANLIERQLISTGLNVKEPYQRRLPSDTSKDYYSIHRDTGNIQPILIQYGSMSDYNDISLNYRKYVDAVVMALSSYLGVTELNDDYYVVKSGDTLYSIARKYNLTVNELKDLNKLSSNFLTIGQRLFVNNDKEDNIDVSDINTYIVKSGDTLYSIARKYNVTIDELKNYNNLNSNLLNIGQILKVPTVISEGENVDYIEYIVKKGDNLYNIARKYNISVSEIMRYNNLNSNLLSIGQILRIPVSEGVNIYIVKSGDNLYSIARKYNTSVDNIKAKNNLTSNLLSIGQTLVI